MNNKKWSDGWGYEKDYLNNKFSFSLPNAVSGPKKVEFKNPSKKVLVLFDWLICAFDALKTPKRYETKGD